ncbi:MAG: OmpA family protein [Bacteroidia bacterium]|nr:OmpA family protein [Bacteroidia bacterium]
MKSMKIEILIITSLLLLSGCTGKFKKEIALKDEKIGILEDQLAFAQGSTQSLLKQMEDLSIISKSGAESIGKSLDNISQQNNYIQNLTSKIQTKDSINLALVMNLKRSLADVNDEDIDVEVRGGVVYVSISDRLLFRSGSIRINSAAQSVIGKIATVINDHNNLQVMVEGHTDDVPMNTECIEDNWDLSVKRATAVVRSLTMDHYVSPERLTAAGRSEFIPKSDNETSRGRSLNRRPEIIIQPSLEEFFQLMEGPQLVN